MEITTNANPETVNRVAREMAKIAAAFAPKVGTIIEGEPEAARIAFDGWDLDRTIWRIHCPKLMTQHVITAGATPDQIREAAAFAVSLLNLG